MAEARPLIDFDEEIREIDQGQPCRDVVFQVLDTLWPFLRFKRRDDDPPLVHPYLAMAGE
jgi:hypothetical protein